MGNNKDNCPACGNKTEQKCNCCDKHKERSEKEYKDLLNRLKRIEGQVRGVERMIEEMHTVLMCLFRLLQLMLHSTASIRFFSEII